MKNKGFTLIELLAVIVVLAVVALIAFPIIAGIIEKTKRSAAYRSVEGYVEAANNAAVLYDIDNNKGINVTEDKHTFTSDVDTDAFSKIKAKGTLPTYSYLDFDINKKVVTEGHFCINGYSVLYSEGTAKASETKYCEEDNTGGSGSNSGSGNGGSSGNIDSALLNVRYEALGEKDDYLYVKVDDEWKKWQKANLRWDGYIFNTGAFSPETFGDWQHDYSPAADNYVSKTFTYQDQNYININTVWRYYWSTHGGILIRKTPLPKGYSKVVITLNGYTIGDTRGYECYTAPGFTEGSVGILSTPNYSDAAVLQRKSYGTTKVTLQLDTSQYDDRDIYLYIKYSSNTNTCSGADTRSTVGARIDSIQMQ